MKPSAPTPVHTGPPTPASQDRWAHLSYTSSDSAHGEGTGGWQVKQASALLEAEWRRVLADIPTALPVGTPRSRYPSREDVAALPRRLAFIPHSHGSALIVQTVPAGNDASGRPGNVFSHALLDRWLAADLLRPDPVRPIELWRAPHWLDPYGPDEVRGAWFDDRQPVVPGETVSRDTVIDFLYDEQRGRLDALLRLLDATSAALTSGRPVVIVAQDTDEGAFWIGLVSFLAAPPACARLSFSTYEGAADILRRGPQMLLSVVLREDYDGVTAERDRTAAAPGGPLFLDPSPAGASAPPGTPDGIPQRSRSDWAELVRHLYRAGDELLDDRLLAMDAISARYSRVAVPACPWWALALSVAECPELEPAWPTAARALLRATPVLLRADTTLAERVQTLTSRNTREGSISARAAVIR